MGFLRVTSDQLSGEFELDGESIKVGRSRDNKVRLPHKSVSRHHAVIREEEGRLIVKDLASSYGTYVNEEKVTEGTAEDGDVVRFGRIRMVYETKRRLPTPPGYAPPPANGSRAESTPDSEATPVADEADNGAGEGRPCDKHPGKNLSLVCPKCRLRFCDSCVNRLEVSGAEKSFCPYCKEACKPLGLYQIEEDRRKARESQTFFSRLPEIMGHPFSASAAPVLIVGTLLYLATAYLARYSVWLTLPIIFYVVAFLHNIVGAAADGDEELPSWPNPGDPWDGVVRPALMFTLSAGVAFLPLIAYLWHVHDAGLYARPSAVFPLTAWALIYLPFSVLSTATADHFSGANPIRVLSAFSRLHFKFMFAAILALVMVGVRFALANVVGAFIALPALPELMTGFFTSYFLLLELRLLGILYHTNRNELRWHDE
jgi:hypothetical protein